MTHDNLRRAHEINANGCFHFANDPRGLRHSLAGQNRERHGKQGVKEIIQISDNEEEEEEEEINCPLSPILRLSEPVVLWVAIRL